MAKPPRKHHFVQAEHIRQFTGLDGSIQVFGKDGKIFTKSPESLFKKKDLNSFDGDNGLNTDFEHLVTEIENECWPTLKRIIQNENIEEKDVEHVAMYLSLSRLRNPTVQSGILEFHRQTIETTAKLMDSNGHFDSISPNPINPDKSLSELLESGQLVVSINNSEYLRALMTMFDPFMKILVGGFRWSIVKSPLDRVILSDHPLTYLHPSENPGPYGIPPGGKGCEMAFPLSKSLYLVGLWEHTVGNVASEDVVDELNKRQAIFSNRHIASALDNRHIRNLALRYKHFGFQTISNRVGPLDGSYQIMRAGVYQLPGTKRFKGKHPLENTKPLKQRLSKFS